MNIEYFGYDGRSANGCNIKQRCRDLQNGNRIGDNLDRLVTG